MDDPKDIETTQSNAAEINKVTSKTTNIPNPIDHISEDSTLNVPNLEETIESNSALGKIPMGLAYTNSNYGDPGNSKNVLNQKMFEIIAQFKDDMERSRFIFEQQQFAFNTLKKFKSESDIATCLVGCDDYCQSFESNFFNEENAERNKISFKRVKSLNGLFETQQNFVEKKMKARKAKSCNEMDTVHFQKTFVIEKLKANLKKKNSLLDILDEMSHCAFMFN